MKKIAAIITVLVFVYSCDSDDSAMNPGPEPSSFDRTLILENWADNIIIPGYQDFTSKVAALETAALEFTIAQDETSLETLRLNWLEAYTTWQRVSLFETGPAEDIGLRLNMNIYPANTDLIESNILSGIYDLTLSSNRVAKGFPALDFLLHGDTDSAILERFQTDANARQYLTDIVVDMRALSTQVRDEWTGGFRDTFVANNGSSATASVDRFVNDYIFYFERFLRAGKMGIPGGVFSGTVEPQNIEAFYKGDISKTLFLEGLNATQDFFNGVAYNGSSQGESLSSYLVALNAVSNGVDLNTIINQQFDTARNAVQALGSFAEELQIVPPIAFLEAYDKVQILVPLLKVDMVSAMSISIDFADADGD